MFLISNKQEQLKSKLEKKIGLRIMQEKLENFLFHLLKIVFMTHRFLFPKQNYKQSKQPINAKD